MGGLIGIGVAIINLFLSGPLLTFAWRSRGYLADATAVDLTRDPDGLAQALGALAERRGRLPGTAWLELLQVVGSSGGGRPGAGRVPSLSDTGLTVSLAPPIDKRLRRLEAMGASTPEATSTMPEAGRAAALAGPAASPRRRFPIWLGILIIVPLVALVAVLLVIAVALIVYLVAFAAFVVLAIVAGPLHDLLRGLAGR